MSPQKSNKCRKWSSKAQTKGATQLPSDEELKDKSVTIVSNNLCDKIEEDWMRKFWDEIQEANMDKEDKWKSPLIELALYKPQAKLEIQSRYNMVESSDKSSRNTSSLKELLSFFGNDSNSVDDIRKIPSQYKLSISMLDTTTLHALLSAKVRVIMTLAKVLEKKPEL